MQNAYKHACYIRFMTADDRCAEQVLDSSTHFTQTSYLCKQVFNSALTHPHISCYVNMHVRAALLATSVLSLATLAQHEFMYNMTDINFIPIHISNFWYEDLTRCLCVYVYKRYTLCINVYFFMWLYIYVQLCVCAANSELFASRCWRWLFYNELTRVFTLISAIDMPFSLRAKSLYTLCTLT